MNESNSANQEPSGTQKKVDEMPDPNTGLTRENLAEAKYLIDIIAMLQEKTKGNLTQEEAAAMEEAVYGLRMRYVRKVSPDQQAEEG